MDLGKQVIQIHAVNEHGIAKICKPLALMLTGAVR
jgi:hypothetical protein